MGGVILTGIMLTWFGWLPALPSVSIGSNNGCSVICFLFLYMIGRYLRLFGIPRLFVKYNIVIYVFCSVLIAGIAWLILNFVQISSEKMNLIIQRIYANNNPVIIISSIAFFSFFKSLNINSSRAINYVAKSTLAILLFHSCGPFFNTYMLPHFRYLYENYTGLTCAILWLISVLIIGVIAVAIDQIRLLTFKFISGWLNKRAEKVVIFIDNKL